MKLMHGFCKKLLLYAVLALICSTGKIVSRELLPGDEQYILTAEKMPTPVGGLEGIMKKISYPAMAMKTGTEGKVYMLLYVNESGDVDDVKVVKGIGGGCDEEAAKAIKKTKFTPGMDKGVAVKTKFSLAVMFKIPT